MPSESPAKLALTLDSTQIDNFLTCPRLWFYGDKLRLTSRLDDSTKDAMLMGTYGHKILEIYYKGLAEGLTITQAQEQGMNFDPDLESEHCMNCNLVKEEHPCKDGCQLFISKPFPLGKPEREVVRKQIRMYIMTYASRDFTVKTPEQVELGFSHNLYEDDNYLFILEGRIDVLSPIFTNGMELGYVDHKFQMRRRDLYKKSIQFKNYALVTNSSMNMVNYIRLTKEINKDTFHRDLISFSAIEHQAWRERLIGIYKVIAQAIKNSQENPQYWQTMVSNPNWASCSGKFGYPCDFTPLCEETSPQAALVKIDSMYRRREEWRPW